MRYIIEKLSHREAIKSDQNGSALVICMLVLVVVTTVGILSIQTSVTETAIALNEQRWEEDFNLSEGGTAKEAGDVGFADPGRDPWFMIADPDLTEQVLVPPDDNSFDPADDMDDATPLADFLALSPQQRRERTALWPRQNLKEDLADNRMDYAYLVTYLGASPRGVQGFDASSFAAYQFRINAEKRAVVEIGGLKIGVKSN